MSEDMAIDLAIEAIEAQMKTLSINADLCDIWSIPQPTELITCDYRTPRRVAASEQRKKLRIAITVLRRLLPEQRTMELER